MNICRCGRPRQRRVSGPKASKPNTGYFTCECDNKFEWENDRGAALLADAGPLCGCGRASVQWTTTSLGRSAAGCLVSGSPYLLL